jgi:hypothetical protein
MMAIVEAAKYSAVEELRSGRRVKIRALRPDERSELLAPLAAPAQSLSSVVSSL